MPSIPGERRGRGLEGERAVTCILSSLAIKLYLLVLLNIRL